MGQRKIGCLAIILFVTITKSESKIIKFTSGVLQLCSIQEKALVTTNCSQKKKKNLGKQWIFKDEKNLIYSECLYYSISDELGCHGNHCFINFKSCWFFLPFLPHEIRESKNNLPFKSETKITKLLCSEQWLMGPFKLTAAGPQNHVKQEKFELCIWFSMAIYDNWQQFIDTRNPILAEASWITVSV